MGGLTGKQTHNVTVAFVRGEETDFLKRVKIHCVENELSLSEFAKIAMKKYLDDLLEDGGKFAAVSFEGQQADCR